MKRFYCHKVITAGLITAVGAMPESANVAAGEVIEITLEDGSQFQEVGERFKQAKPGQFFVVYEDGYKSVNPSLDGYTEVIAGRMPFGVAVHALKAGKAIAREGWNGKGLFVYLVPANSYPAATDIAKAYFGVDGKVPYNAYMAIKNADGTVSTWAPSGSDALADDWKIVDVDALCQYATESGAASQVHPGSALPSVTIHKGHAVGWSADIGKSVSSTFSKTGPQVKVKEHAPRVTIEDIHAAIASEHYFTAGDGVIGMLSADGVPATVYERSKIPAPLNLLTFCTLVLKNGFTVTGQLACVSAANFDADLGRKYAYEDAIEKCWPLLGFALAERQHAERNKPPAAGAAHPGYSTLQPHQQRVVDEKAELDDKLAKLLAFLVLPMFARLPEDEQHRLTEQSNIMRAYSAVLGYRIAAF